MPRRMPSSLAQLQVSVFAGVSVYVQVYTCVCVFVQVSVFASVSESVYVYTCVCVFVQVSVFASVSVYVYVCTCVCVFVRLYRHTYALLFFGVSACCLKGDSLDSLFSSKTNGVIITLFSFARRIQRRVR